MATSGTYNYLATAGVIVTEALRKIGVVEEGTSASTAQIEDAMPALEMFLKSLGNKGLMVWKVQKASITLVASTNAYTYDVNYRFTEITDIQYRDSSGYDTPMIELSREEYSRQNNKSLEGQPTQYWWDKAPVPGDDRVYVWPAPDTANAGSSQALIVTGILPIEDADDSTPDGTYDIDLPSEWYEAVAYGLAVRLAPHFGIPITDRRELRAEYKEILEDTLNFDRETASVYFRAARRGD